MSNPRLDAAYVAQVKAVRQRVEAYTRSRFLAGQYRDADLERFIKQVVPVVLAGRRQVSSLTDSYLSQTLSATLGRPVPPRGPIDTALLRGVAPGEVYSRPYVVVRTKLSKDQPLDAAINAGLARLSDLVLTDMQMAKTYTAQSVFSNAGGFDLYRRVLVGSVNCAMCSTASTQTYSREDLLPIHPGCNCDVEAITLDAPWDQAAADQRLTDTHSAVLDRLGVSDSGARAPDYRKQLLVREHGELGPVLTVRGQHFQGRSVMDN